MKRINRNFIVLALTTLILTITHSTVFATFVEQSTDGKQIVFLLDDPAEKFMSVSVSGYNQNNAWVTWNNENPNGFYLAYTKDWWWTENFVQISFTLQDEQGNQTQQTCTFDRLLQPIDSPRVEIIYHPEQGCIGGEAGNVRDPVNDLVKPVSEGLTIIGNYLPEDKFNFFMTLMNNEMNSVGCVVGVGTMIKTGGMAALDGTVRNYVMKTCQSTGNMVISLFSNQ